MNNLQYNSKEELLSLIKNKDEWVIGALLTLHNDSKEIDSGDNWLSSIAKYYLSKEYLTTSQIIAVRHSITKYINQIYTLGCKPCLVKEFQTTKNNVQTKQVSLISDSKIKIVFPYNPDMVLKIKSLDNRQFNSDNPKDKHWVAKLTIGNIEELIDWEFNIPKELQSWYEKQTAIKKVKIETIPGLKKEIFPYQHEGVEFLDAYHGKGIIGDEVQVGKTAQAIAWLQLRQKALPAVVLCPATIKFKWEWEFKQFTNFSIHVISKRDTDIDLPKADIYIINYDILGEEKTIKLNDKKSKKMSGWYLKLYSLVNTVIADEANYLKNPKAIRTKAFIELVKNKPHFIPIAATPIENSPIEFFTILHEVNPVRFPSRFKFAQTYCGAKQITIWKKNKNGKPSSRQVWDFTGSSNLDKLHQELKHVMIRRTQEDVGLKLPTQIEIIPIQINNYQEYKYAETNFIEWLHEVKGSKKGLNASKAIQLAKIEYLRQIIQKGKMDTIISWVKDFLESGQKLIIFGHHTEVTINPLVQSFKDISVNIIGGVPTKKRFEIVNEFNNNDKIKLFIGSLAAREGIPLKAASNVCFTELWWKSTQHDQGSGRMQGVGQTAKSLKIWYFIAKDTIEEDISQLLDKKRTTLDMILDGKETEQESLLRKLMDKYSKKG